MGNLIIAGNKNIIDKDNLAKLRHYILGGECVFTSKLGYRFGLTYSDNQFTIGKGILSIYGYYTYSKEEVTFDYINANTVQYWFVYAELDMSVDPNLLKIKKVNNGKSKVRTFRKDVLYNENTGVYQKALYRIKIEQEGITEIADVRFGGYIVPSTESSIAYLSIPNYVYEKYHFNSELGKIVFYEEDKIEKSSMVTGEYYYAQSSGSIYEYLKLGSGLSIRYYRTKLEVEYREDVIVDDRIHSVIRSDYAEKLDAIHEGDDIKIGEFVFATTQNINNDGNQVATTAFVHNLIDYYLQ